MPRRDSALEIYNGARCVGYRWAQSHTDIEVKIDLGTPVRYDNLSVDLSPRHIRIRVVNLPETEEESALYSAGRVVERTLIEGNFEDTINPETVYWILDADRRPGLIIYLDKGTAKWWDQFLQGEQVIEKGPVNHVADLEDLEDGSRMAIDKLIYDHKLRHDNDDGDDFSLF